MFTHDVRTGRLMAHALANQVQLASIGIADAKIEAKKTDDDNVTEAEAGDGEEDVDEIRPLSEPSSPPIVMTETPGRIAFNRSMSLNPRIEALRQEGRFDLPRLHSSQSLQSGVNEE